MRAVYKHLLDNSISASLSAIEIYNKPDFKYRNEIFVILIINSWELLFKAKILKDNKKINSIYAYDGRKIKKNRNKAPLTIEIIGAMNKIGVDSVLEDNLFKLIEIRDTAIHFYNRDFTKYLIYALGAASLRNYHKLMKDWFNKDLLEYNFYILPLGFVYNFKTFSVMELNKEPDVIKNLIADISEKQKDNKTENDGFYLVCEVETKMISAKKLSDATDLVVKIDPSSPTTTIIKKEKLTDQYPLSYKELRDKISKKVRKTKMKKFDSFIKTQKIKFNTKYSAFNFRTKIQEETYKKSSVLPKGITSIYNNDCVEYISSNL